MQYTITNLHRRISKDLQEKKEAIIKQKFKEKGFAHLLENLDSSKRFKRVVIEISPDCERWYADDGTDEGVLILTIKNYNISLKNEFIEDPIILNVELQYS